MTLIQRSYQIFFLEKKLIKLAKSKTKWRYFKNIHKILQAVAIPCYGPVTIELSASSPLTRIRVGIDAAEPLIVTRTSFIVNSLSKYLNTTTTVMDFYVLTRSSLYRQ